MHLIFFDFSKNFTVFEICRLKLNFLCERYSHCIYSSCSIELTKTGNTWCLSAVSNNLPNWFFKSVNRCDLNLDSWSSMMMTVVICVQTFVYVCICLHLSFLYKHLYTFVFVYKPTCNQPKLADSVLSDFPFARTMSPPRFPPGAPSSLCC